MVILQVNVVEPAKARLSTWVQGEMFHCYPSASAMVVGPSRKETFLNSRGVLELASLVKLDRVVGLVTYWLRFRVGPSRRAARSRSGNAAANRSLLLTKLELRDFGTFLVGDIGSVYALTRSVTACQERSALGKRGILKFNE